jgi:hypothetical protein
MCEMCDGATWDDVVRRTRATIAEYGWQLQLVEGDAADPPLCYTVGLTARGLPELLLTGRGTNETATILNSLAQSAVHGGLVLEPGMELVFFQRRVHLAPIAAPDGVLLIADSLYGSSRLRALQVVWADDSDCLPWEQDVVDVLTQPLFGSPPEHVLLRGGWARREGNADG